jgi:hypothetical protein
VKFIDRSKSSRGVTTGVAKMPPTNPTSSVITEQLTRALGEAVIRIWSNLPQRGAKSFVSGGSHISRRVHKIAACSFPARQAFTHCGPIRQASRNAGARQPRRLARVLLVSTPARGRGGGRELDNKLYCIKLYCISIIRLQLFDAEPAAVRELLRRALVSVEEEN